jgi:hypothetical protein
MSHLAALMDSESVLLLVLLFKVGRVKRIQRENLALATCKSLKTTVKQQFEANTENASSLSKNSYMKIL